MSKDIKRGDSVIPEEGYDNIRSQYFFNGPLKVTMVVDNNLQYTGYKFVYCEFGNKEVGFYINALKKW